MSWADVTVEHIAYASAGLVLAIFAVWLLALSPRQRATRALATLMIGMSVAWSFDLVWLLLKPGVQARITFVTPVSMTVIGLATVYFLSVYPRPRGWLGKSRWGGWTMLAIGAAFAALFYRAPELYARFEIIDGAPAHVDNGPLVLLSNAWTLTAVAMLYVFALDLRSAQPGPLRRSLVLVLAGFLTSMLVWTGALFLNDVTGRLDPRAIDASFARVAYVLEEASFLAALGAAAIVIVHAWRSSEATIRREAHAIGGLVAVTIGIVATVTFLGGRPDQEDWISPAQGIVDALGGVAIAAFAGYALLKHRLFDIDVRLRWTISRGTVAAIFVAVFFAASQVAQNFLEDSMGWALGGLIAGVMLFAIAPVQRLAERVAVTAVPVQASPPEDRKVELYRMALALALSDRLITRDEERHLARLAEELGVTHTQALAAREEMERELGLTA